MRHSSKETNKKVNGWRKIYHVNTNQKKAEVAMLISDRADFKVRKVIRDSEGHDTMIKGQFSKKTQQSLTCTHLTTEHQTA